MQVGVSIWLWGKIVEDVGRVLKGTRILDYFPFLKGVAV